MAITVNIPSEVTQTITDGVTITAPSENAVFDALATKADASEITGLVPYTGATSDLDLGTNSLITEKVFLYDDPNDNFGSIHFTDGNFHIEDGDGHPLFVVEDGFVQLHKSEIIQSNLYTSGLTQTRDHYLPNASGTIALTSDIPTFTPMPIKQNVSITHTGTTANTIIASYLIPSGTFQANDIFRFSIQTSQIVNANIKTLRVYINTSTSLTGATLIATRTLTSLAGCNAARDLVFKNSLSSQEIYNVTSNIADNESANSSISMLSINFHVNQFFIVAVELANVSDSVIFNYLRTNIFR
jgi:hypothetical protein